MDRFTELELIEVRRDGSPARQMGQLSKQAEEAIAATVAHYARAGFDRPWVSYLARIGPGVAGICAFTAAPKNGRVEIAYHTFVGFEGRGVATAMAMALVKMARETGPEMELVAQTLPVQNASNAVLQKAGFEFAGAVEHPEEGTVWEWRSRLTKT